MSAAVTPDVETYMMARMLCAPGYGRKKCARHMERIRAAADPWQEFYNSLVEMNHWYYRKNWSSGADARADYQQDRAVAA